MRTLLKQAWVVDPANQADGIQDILLEKGKIVAIGHLDDSDAAVVYDLEGKHVFPGFVDIHVHFREPGFEYKEDIESGSRAAVKGGVTTVACMPNTRPTISTLSDVKYIQDRAKSIGLCRVEIVGSITKGLQGETPADFKDMLEAGIVAVSDDGRTTMDERLMLEAFEAIKPYDAVLISHAEDHALTVGAVLNEGPVSDAFGLKGIPKRAEYGIVERDIALSVQAGARLHIAHVSTVEALEAVKRAKAAGHPVTCEVGPQHFLLTDADIPSVSATEYKVNPPLRSAADRDAMVQGLMDGSIDAIATDHAPHSAEDKAKPMAEAAFGMSGIETSFALSYTHLVKTGLISLSRLVSLMAAKPAEIIRKPVGTLSIGASADLVVMDLGRKWVIDPVKFVSKGKNAPFKGFEVYGVVEKTFMGGKLVYREEKTDVDGSTD